MDALRAAMIWVCVTVMMALAPPVSATQPSVPPDVGNYNYGYIRCDSWVNGYASRSEDETTGANALYGAAACSVSIITYGPWGTTQNPQEGPCGGDIDPPGYYLGVETFNITGDLVHVTYGTNCSGSYNDGFSIHRFRSVNCPDGYTPNGQTNLCDPPVSIDPNKNNDTCPIGGCNGTDPIHLATGALLQKERDFSDPSDVLNFERYYSSSNANNVPQFDLTNLGPQWRHTFDRRISVVTSGSVTVATAYRANGDRYHFVLSGSSVWTPDAGVAIVLTSTSDGSGNITGWTLTDTDGTKETYDTNGYLTQILRQDQRSANLVYAGIYLQTVTDDRGRTLTFKYAPISYQSLTELVEVDCPDGLSIIYQYDPTTGMLTSATYSATVAGQVVSQSRTYVYGENGAHTYAMTGLVAEDSQRYSSWTYDASGRANLSVHGSFTDYAGRAELTYNSDGSTTLKNWIDYSAGLSLSRQFSFNIYQGVAHLAAVACPSCQSAAIQLPGLDAPPAASTFDPSGYPTSSTDYNSVLTKTTYDDNYGLLTQQIDASGTANQRTTKTTWDAAIREPTLRQVLDVNNNLVAQTKWVYNSYGEVTARCDADPTVSGATSYTCATTGTPVSGVRRWVYQYCTTVNTTNCPETGLLLSVDGPRTDISDLWTYTYYMQDGTSYRHGDLATVTDPLGHVAQYLAYDGAGRLLTSEDANGVYTDLTYTPRGWLASRTIRIAPNNTPASTDVVTSLTYTAYGALASITDPDGVKMSLTYNAAHWLTDITDVAGNHIHYVLNSAGEKTSEQILTKSGSVLQSQTRQYDVYGRLTAVVDGLSHTVFGANYSDSYDGNGNLTHSMDALTFQRQQGFDALNRLIKVVDNYNGADPATSNTQTLFGYDAMDRLTGVNDPASVSGPTGLLTAYAYDGLSDRTSVQSPDTGTSTDTFDAAGNRLVHTNAKGVVSTSSYDALNRLLRVRTPADTTTNVTYAYDQPNSVTGCTTSWPIGRLTVAATSNVSTVFCYDARGNVIQKMVTYSPPSNSPPSPPSTFATNLATVTEPGTATTQFTYTNADRLSTIVQPSGALVSYAYNTNGMISGIQVTPYNGTLTTVVSNATWMPFGPLSGYTLGNGQVVTRTFDANYRLTDLVSPALTLHFGHDSMGDISAIGNAPGASPATETYKYDPLYRLLSLTEANGTVLESYTYNTTGDRLSKTAPGVATGPYTYTTGTHQLASIGGVSQANDATGNTTGSTIGSQTYGFAYNALNQMLLAQQGGITIGTYTYDAFGQRIRKLTASGQNFSYDQSGHLTGDYGLTSHDYVWLGDTPVASVDYGTSTTINFITADQLGTPRAVSNGAGAVIWQWTYQGNPFGEQQPTSTTGYVLNLRYPGQYYDAETGTNYNLFRTYEPGTGRYLQSDPIGLNGGVSTYAYVGGDPLSFIDSLGLAACPPGVKAFFQALGPTIRAMSADMDVDPNYMFALSAYESGWYGPHAQSLDNPFGLTHGGGNDIQFSSIGSAAQYFEGRIGPSVVDADSFDEFVQDIRGEGYNSKNPNYDSVLKNVYKSVKKFEANCDCTDKGKK